MGLVRNDKYYTGTVYEWNLPAGHTCPFAAECKVRVFNDGSRIQSVGGSFSCYAANAEQRYPSVRKSRWGNYNFVKAGGVPEITVDMKAVRVHASGDFFSQEYFDMWLRIAREHLDKLFWAFTKSLPYWIARIGSIPSNLVLTASYGGLHDALIGTHGLKSVRVVGSVEEAGGMPIDYNDDLARIPYIDFCLLDNRKRQARGILG